MRLLLLLSLSACGSAGTLATTVHLSQELAAADIQSADVFVLSDRSTSGEPVTCELLASGVLTAPAFDTFIVVRHVVAATGPVELGDIPSGLGLVIAIEAFATTDALTAPVGVGCSEGVSLEKGKQKRVDITLVPR